MRGRVVDGTVLERRRTFGFREFESHRIRQLYNGDIMAQVVEYVKTDEDDTWIYYNRIVDGMLYCKSLVWKGHKKN